jgi:DNA-binding transcriptional LysR family regulator
VLVADALAEGRLVRPFAPALSDGTGYHLVMTEGAARRPAVQAFAAWLAACLGAKPS